MTDRTNRQLIERFYGQVWNQWDADAAREILSPDIVFRGSLGVDVRGHDGFLGYVELIRAAFPDFHNRIEEIISEGTHAAARLTYSGTHKGMLFGTAATGRAITYAGAAFFQFSDGKIDEIWVLGDRMALMEQINAA
jgi:steroid delta-isomerase-like uncharacterized protein